MANAMKRIQLIVLAQALTVAAFGCVMAWLFTANSSLVLTDMRVWHIGGSGAVVTILFHSAWVFFPSLFLSTALFWWLGQQKKLLK
jgi:hypothetical protein